MTIGKVNRETTATIRDCGKERVVVVTIHPNGTIGLRLKGTRREYYSDVAALYQRLEKDDAESEAETSVAPCRNPKKRIGVA